MMRTLFAWALLLLVGACADRSERPATSGALASIPAGPDPIVLRVPRGGGLVAAVQYPNLDSIVWRSSFRLPPLSRVLGYNPDDGYLTAVDTSGRPVRLDLRLGAVAIPGSAGAMQHASADGAILYAVNADGEVARYTPVGDSWALRPAAIPAELVPLNDGSVVVVTRNPADLLLRRLRPPDSVVVDSMRLDVTADSASVHGLTVADRMFLSAGSKVYSLRTRDFALDVEVDVGAPVRHVVTSPSGDRIFVLRDGLASVSVIDRFEGEVVSEIELPGSPRDLRMDQLGRVLLVRAPGDSVWVIDMGSTALVGALRTAWRDDLPLVMADGAIALIHGDTVTMASSVDLSVVRTLPDGAKDFWYAMRWNGFRPRAEGLDEPVRFRASQGGGASREVAGTLDDSATAPSADSTRGDSVAATALRPKRPARTMFTVQLAAVLTEELARKAATGVSVAGRTPRIASSVRNGRTLYRVVLGPYPTREAAEAAGKSTGRTYWVFEGAP